MSNNNATNTEYRICDDTQRKDQLPYRGFLIDIETHPYVLQEFPQFNICPMGFYGDKLDDYVPHLVQVDKSTIYFTGLNLLTFNSVEFDKRRSPAPRRLDLSHNLFVACWPHELRRFDQVVELDLSHCAIEFFDVPLFSTFDNLQWLNLSHNMLSWIPKDLLVGKCSRFFFVPASND